MSLPTPIDFVQSYIDENSTNASVVELAKYGQTKPAYVVGYHAAYTSVLESAVKNSLDSLVTSVPGPFVFGRVLNLENGVTPTDQINEASAPDKYVDGTGTDVYNVSAQAGEWTPLAADAHLDIGRYYLIYIPTTPLVNYSIKLSDTDLTPVAVNHGDAVAIKWAGPVGSQYKTFEKIDGEITTVLGSASVAVEVQPGTNNFTVALSEATAETLSGLTSSVGTLQTDVGTLQTDVGTATTNITTLLSSVEGLTTSVGTLVTDLDTLEGAALTSVTAGPGITVETGTNTATVSLNSSLSETLNDTLTKIMSRLQTVNRLMVFMESSGLLIDENGSPYTFSEDMNMKLSTLTASSLINDYGTNTGIARFPTRPNITMAANSTLAAPIEAGGLLDFGNSFTLIDSAVVPAEIGIYDGTTYLKIKDNTELSNNDTIASVYFNVVDNPASGPNVTVAVPTSPGTYYLYVSALGASDSNSAVSRSDTLKFIVS